MHRAIQRRSATFIALPPKANLLSARTSKKAQEKAATSICFHKFPRKETTLLTPRVISADPFAGAQQPVMACSPNGTLWNIATITPA
jgi:hypothetical protein